MNAQIEKLEAKKSDLLGDASKKRKEIVLLRTEVLQPFLLEISRKCSCPHLSVNKSTGERNPLGFDLIF